MKHPVHLLAIFLLVLAGALHADDETLRIEATGYGDSPHSAITHGLLEAARQGLGVGISLDPDFGNHVHEWVVHSTEGVSTLTGRRYSRPEARQHVLAAVRGYQVHEVSRAEEGLWQARVEAELLQYRGLRPDLEQLPSLAVARFRTDQEEYNVGEWLSGDRLARRLRQALVNSFSDSHRVRVLDRSFDDEAFSELERTASSLSPGEQLRQGQEIGADLLMVGEIEQFQLGGKERDVYGIQMTTLEPAIRISYRLLEPATREILRSDTFVYREEGAYLRDRLNEAGIRASREPERIGEVLFPDVARPLSREVLDTLHPMRILAPAGGNRVYISRGRGSLKEGTLLSVHEVGREIHDPDTNLGLRLETDAQATLRVTSVNRDYGRAELINGDPDVLRRNVILRVAATPEEDDHKPGQRPLSPGSSEAPLDWGE